MQFKYFEDPYLFQFGTRVSEQSTLGDQDLLICEDTIFYPQGGGQASDRGIISGDGFEFQVNKTVKDGKDIIHLGHFLSGKEANGDVSMKIDESLRKMHCQIHTGGHMLDVAMLKIGTELLPTKGYHFPDSPYVEYSGIIPEEERAETIALLNTSLKDLISEDHPIQSEWVRGKEAVSKLCPFLPDYLNFEEEIRIVTVADNMGCPCAGTHVKSTSEIAGIEVTKIKSKKGNTRVSYRILEQV